MIRRIFLIFAAYHVIHRIASYPDVRGIFSGIIYLANGDERLAYQKIL